MLCRRPVWRRARRASALVFMTTLLSTIPAMVAAAATAATGPKGAGATDSAAVARTTVLGLPVITGAWALFGALALLVGLVIASRGARSARQSAHLIGLNPLTDAVGAGIGPVEGPNTQSHSSAA